MTEKPWKNPEIIFKHNKLKKYKKLKTLQIKINHFDEVQGSWFLSIKIRDYNHWKSGKEKKIKPCVEFIIF